MGPLGLIGDFYWLRRSAVGLDRAVPERQLTALFSLPSRISGQDFVISLAGLKGTPEGAMAKPAPGPGVISISDFKFGPETVIVSKGQTISWTNTDSSPHQVTITGPKAQRSSIALKGQTTQLTLADAGVYDYICGLHPAMKGKIEVKE